MILIPSFTKKTLDKIRIITCQLVGVALAWVVLYKLNMWLFKGLEVNPFVSWVFLPAFIRVLSILVFGWTGVFGLIVGALITSQPAIIGESAAIILALISGLAPMIAVSLCVYLLKLPPTLSGIRPSHLFIFAIVGSLVDVCFHALCFIMHEMPSNLVAHLMPMLVGDTIGTIAMLYLASMIIKASVKMASK